MAIYFKITQYLTSLLLSSSLMINLLLFLGLCYLDTVDVDQSSVYNRGVARGGGALPEFGRSVNPIQTMGGRLCPSHYCQPPGFKKLSTPLFKLFLLQNFMNINEVTFSFSKSFPLVTAGPKKQKHNV